MTARILESAGFDDVRFEEVHEPVLYVLVVSAQRVVIEVQAGRRRH